MEKIICDRCGNECTNERWYHGRMTICPSCHDYYVAVDKGLGKEFTIPENCEGCGAKLPYSGICNYCGKNNKKILK